MVTDLQSLTEAKMTDLEKISHAIGMELKTHDWTLVTAESCTGGGIGYWVTSVPGSSSWFEGGFITYSHSAKIKLLNVSANTLETFGSVSEQTAREMAEGALYHSTATMSIAVTGIAGPDGGTPAKPVGTVWFALAARNKPTDAFMQVFSGTRQAVREKTIIAALTKGLDFIRLH
jgi:nicotinamide-nucleotide amidase